MEALFHILVDNIVVGNRSLASCCTLDHFGGVSWDRWGQFCRCLQSSDAMKKHIQLGQGKKLAAIPPSTFCGIRTTTEFSLTQGQRVAVVLVIT